MIQKDTALFEKQVWDAACMMRGKIPTEQYKDIILAIIFLKYANARFEATYEMLKKMEWRTGYKFKDNPQNYIVYNSIYLNQEARWDTIQNSTEKEIGFALDRAMINLKMCNKSLENAVSCNFRSEEIDKRVLKSVVGILSKIDLTDIQTDSDLIGRVYEFCLREFAMNGKGEYYTPKSVVKLLVSIVQPFEGCTLYEPCAGSGGMIVQSYKYLKAHGGDTMKIYAQEAVPNTWRIAKQNMTIRGIRADFGEAPADTFHNDQHKDIMADCIMANPPFNLSSWGYESLKFDARWIYGLPSDTNANYAWFEHMLSHLNENGRMGVVMSNGAGTSQDASDLKIRKNMIEADLIEGIVSLPRNMFYSTTIPATIWFFTKRKKKKRKILFVDAKGFGKKDKHLLEFSDIDIQQISACFDAFRSGKQIDIPGVAKSADIGTVRANNYNLTSGLYIDSQREVESQKLLLKRIKSNYLELESLQEQSRELALEMRSVMDETCFGNYAQEN